MAAAGFMVTGCLCMPQVQMVPTEIKVRRVIKVIREPQVQMEPTVVRVLKEIRGIKV